MTTFQEFFALGMARDLPPLLEPPAGGYVIELGPGNRPVPEAHADFDLPDWDANSDPLPLEDESVSFIHAYHFLEHVANPVVVLREIERVLRSGGVLQCVMPYYSSQLAIQDLDHKSFWCEDTWDALLANPHYDKHGEWRLSVHFCLVAGIVERNLSLFTQLVKE